MKFAKYTLAASLVLGSTFAVVGCKSTTENGVTSDYHAQWTQVAADPKTTTSAAESVLKSDDLQDVSSTSTDVDGVTTGKKADGTIVKVKVEKMDAGSQVSVTVGDLGDPALGAQYAARIKAKAEGK